MDGVEDVVDRADTSEGVLDVLSLVRVDGVGIAGLDESLLALDWLDLHETTGGGDVVLVLDKLGVVGVETVVGTVEELDLERGLWTPQLDADELCLEGRQPEDPVGVWGLVAGVLAALVVFTADVGPDVVWNGAGLALVAAKEVGNELAAGFLAWLSGHVEVGASEIATVPKFAIYDDGGPRASSRRSKNEPLLSGRGSASGAGRGGSRWRGHWGGGGVVVVWWWCGVV